MPMGGLSGSGDSQTAGRAPHTGAPELRLDRLISRSVIAIAVLVTICVVYWRVLDYPFVQDDWGQLDALRHTDTRSVLSDALSMKGKLVYRPLSQCYFLLYYKVFRLNPLYFHVFGLMVHLVNSLLVVIISWKLTRIRAISALSGLIYAAAVTIHLDPLIWMVGFFDLSATFFYLAAIALFLAERRFLCAAAFGVGLLAKESVVVLVLIFVLILICSVRPVRNLPAAMARMLTPSLLIAAVYFLARTHYAISPFGLPGSEPYAMRLFGIHFVKNFFRYAWWALEAVTPWRNIPGGTAKWILCAIVVGAISLWFLTRRPPCLPLFPRRWILLLSGWAASGILPTLFLPNHYYKYYLTYSLPPLILLSLSAVCRAFHVFRRAARESVSNPNESSGDRLIPFWQPSLSNLALGVLVAIAMADVLSAAWYFRAKDRAGVADRYVVGTNHLIHRGHAAKLILEHLARERTVVPRGSVFLVDGCDLESMGGDDGFRVFYGDGGIRAFRRSDVVMDPDGRNLARSMLQGNADDLRSARIPIEPEKLICLRIVDGEVREEGPVSNQQKHRIDR